MSVERSADTTFRTVGYLDSQLVASATYAVVCTVTSTLTQQSKSPPYQISTNGRHWYSLLGDKND